MTARILILGAGFAGLWSAAGAVRALDEFGIGREAVQVTVVNRDRWHAIRVRNYERDLSGLRVALDEVLQPIGVERVAGEVVGIDFGRRQVTYSDGGAHRSISYDRLVFALGSRLVRPDIPGLGEFAFDVYTYDTAVRLNAHSQGCRRCRARPGNLPPSSTARV